MQSAIAKKAYSSPAISLVGTLGGDTQTGSIIRKIKDLGPGDQFFLTDPPTYIDSHWYNNCEETSA